MGRVNQFFKCITAKLTEEDKNFISEYLSEDECKLIFKLPVYDIKHCVNVARDIKLNESKQSMASIGLNYDQVIKSALLHDIGKAYKPLNPIDKSVLVLLSKFTKGKIKKFEDKSRKIYIYFNHGKEGYEMIKGNDYSEEFLKIVKEHHNYSTTNKWLKLIRKYDDRN